MNIGDQVSRDNTFTKKCRLLQSVYRANVLNEKCGIGPNKIAKKCMAIIL